MTKLDIEYLEIRSNLVLSMEEEEFIEWLDCEDCVAEDYDALMGVLQENNMYDYQIITWEYLQKQKTS